MRHGIKASLLLVLLMTGVGGAAAQSSGNQAKASDMDTDVTKIKHPLITLSMDLLEPLVKQGRLQVYFTHLNHSNPALDDLFSRQARQFSLPGLV